MFKIILPKLNFKIEKWKWNKEYRVYVSTLGHIKNEYKQNVPIKIKSNGYCNIKTNYGYKSVHRLVLLTFKPIPNAEDLTIDHLNHNKRDNSIYNLEWVTKEENERRAKEDYIFVPGKDKLNELIRNAIYNNTNENIKYKNNKFTFNNLDEAVGWVMGMTKAGKGSLPQSENIKARILTAIAEKKEYCGMKWDCIKPKEKKGEK